IFRMAVPPLEDPTFKPEDIVSGSGGIVDEAEVGTGEETLRQPPVAPSAQERQSEATAPVSAG
ncbi:MAG: hypothetical protein AAGF92_24785, partial [Myxococcota bacterium]